MSTDAGEGATPPSRPSTPPTPEQTMASAVRKVAREKKQHKITMFSAGQAAARNNPHQLRAALTQQAAPLIGGAEPPPPTPASIAHRAWLDEMAIAARSLDQKLALHWQEHEKFRKNASFAYYNAMDAVVGEPMLWRFTSIPTQEHMFLIDFTTDRKVLLLKVIHAIDRHTTEYIKNDPLIQLQSFVRNLASFAGTELSRHGDPRVKHIIHTATYLCGIRLSDLGRRGVSAHPALGRLICLPETEYVLVPTPKKIKDPVTVWDLSTVVYRNPFRDDQKFKPTKDVRALGAAPPFPDTMPAEDMPTVQVEAIRAQIDAATRAVDSPRAGMILSNREDNNQFDRAGTEQFAMDYARRFADELGT
jgi:hypothetical protein